LPPWILSSIVDLLMCPTVFRLSSSVVARSGLSGPCGVYMSAVCYLGSEGHFVVFTVVLEQVLVCAGMHLAYSTLFLDER
jgi:hypothetical protein